MKAPELDGWKIYKQLPATEKNEYEAFLEAYKKVGPHRYSGENTSFETILKKSVWCSHIVWLPFIGLRSWAIAAIFSAESGSPGTIKILFPHISDKNEETELDESLCIYTKDNAAKPDVEKLIKNLIIFFKIHTKQSQPT